MTDELDQVVRALEAERHRPSVWWRAPDTGPHTDVAAQLDRIRDLAASTGATFSTPQATGPSTSDVAAARAAINSAPHKPRPDLHAQLADPSTRRLTEAVDSDLDASDVRKDTGGSNQEDQ